MFNKSIYNITKKYRLALVILGSIGLIDTVLIYIKTVGGNLACVVFSGCDSILRSTYSQFFGVHLYILGGIFYSSIILLSIIYNKNIFVKRILFIFITLGFMFSLYLFYTQAFVLREFCIYCLTSFSISSIMFLIILFSKKQKLNLNS